MVGVNVSRPIPSGSGRLFTSLQQSYRQSAPGHPGPGPTAGREHRQPCVPGRAGEGLRARPHPFPRGFAGETVASGLRAVVEETRADEIIVTGQIYDHAARLRSFEIVGQVRDALARKPKSNEGKRKAAAKTEGEGECFAAGPLRASGHIRTIQPWFAGLVPLDSQFFPRLFDSPAQKLCTAFCGTGSAPGRCRSAPNS